MYKCIYVLNAIYDISYLMFNVIQLLEHKLIESNKLGILKDQ